MKLISYIKIIVAKILEMLILIKFSRKEKKKMAKRTTTKRRKDRRIFSRTAKKTKAMNITPKIMRGGTRL